MTEAYNPHGEAFRVGDWVVEPLPRRLQRGSETRRLEPKVMDVLLCLVENAGQAVSREALDRAVWEGAIVGPDTLNRAISKLRQALDEDPAAPRYIETIPKLGYRLIAEVRPVDSAVDAVTSSPRRAGRMRRVALFGALAVVAGGVASVVSRPWEGRSDSPVPVDEPLAVAPVTSLAGYESWPSVSPAGRYVAFQRYDPKAAGPRTWDLYLTAIDANVAAEPVAASELYEHSPAWSPRGDTIAFVREGAERCSLALVPAFGGSTIELRDCEVGGVRGIAWFPGAHDLAISAGKPDEGVRLLRLSRPDGRLAPLTSPPPSYVGDLHPTPSADGRQLAFVRRRRDGLEDLYLLELGDPNAEPRRLTHDNRRIGGLAWSPNGRELLFTSNRGGNSHLWRLPLDGGAPRRIAMSGRNAGHISTSPSGVLVYEEYTGDTNIWELELGTVAGAEPRPWTTSTRGDWSPRFAPDGDRVVWISDRSGSAEVWVSDRRRTAPRQVTNLRGGVLDPPQWSPDGRSLVYAAAPNDNFDVFVLSLATLEARRLTDHAADDRAPSWSADGTSVQFASDRGGDWQLWRVRVDGGTDPVALTTTGGFASLTGPDGSIYFTRPERDGLWRRDTDGSTESVWAEMDAADWANWTVRPDGVYYLRVAAVEWPRLEMFEFASGRARVLYESRVEATGQAGLAVSPDGAHLLYSRVDRSESDLWLLRLP